MIQPIPTEKSFFTQIFSSVIPVYFYKFTKTLYTFRVAIFLLSSRFNACSFISEGFIKAEWCDYFNAEAMRCCINKNPKDFCSIPGCVTFQLLCSMHAQVHIDLLVMYWSKSSDATILTPEQCGIAYTRVRRLFVSFQVVLLFNCCVQCMLKYRYMSGGFTEKNSLVPTPRVGS